MYVYVLYTLNNLMNSSYANNADANTKLYENVNVVSLSVNIYRTTLAAYVQLKLAACLTGLFCE